MAILGIICFVLAIYTYQQTQHFLAQGIQTTGTISKINSENDFGSFSFNPVVNFIDQNGKEWTYTSTLNAARKEYHPGDKVTLVYNPQNPEQAMIVTFWELYLWTFICGTIAWFSLVSAAIFYFLLAKRITI